MTTETKNAVIKSVSLTTADHGVLSAWLHLDYGGSGQGFGGYALCSADNDDNGQDIGGRFIACCMRVGGVSRWEDLPGKVIRVRVDRQGIQAVGHAIEDKWFCPAIRFKGEQS